MADRAILTEGQSARALMWFLAFIASGAPFIGLFGTVYGIMDAFIRIGAAKTASLPVVAPAIGEALITTAIGLAAAIPAVFFYNWIDKRVGDFVSELEASAAEWVAHPRRRALGAGRSAIPLVGGAAVAERRRHGPLDGQQGQAARSREINVTPLVDVMLVLLIVFMVTAPLLTSGLHIDLPEVQAANTPIKDAKLVVSITKDEQHPLRRGRRHEERREGAAREPARPEGARALHPRRQGGALRRRGARGGRRAGRGRHVAQPARRAGGDGQP